jgi:PAS domain S-box-containing protein
MGMSLSTSCEAKDTVSRGSPANCEVIHEALDALSDGVYVLDHTWRIIYLNTHCAREWGVVKDDVLGQIVWEALPILKGSELAFQFAKVVREQTPTRFTTPCALKPECWVELRVYPSKAGLIAHFTEVTERIMASRAARSQEKKIRAILDTAPALISYVNTDCRYTIANRKYQLWSGLPQEQIVGSSIEEVWGEAGWRVIAPKIARAFAGEHVAYEAQIVYRDGSKRWLRCSYTPDRDAYGNVCGVMVLSTDLSEQKRVELDLREREAYHSSVFDASGVGNAEVDLASFKFLRVNQRFCELLKYSEAELLGDMSIWDVTHPDNRAHQKEEFDRLLWAGGDSSPIEQRYLTKDGEIVWVSITVTVLKSASGHAQRLLVVAQDISERKRAEQLLREADRRKDEFLAILAHELRNPLAPISNALQVWSHLETKPEQARAVREMMERQVWQLKRLIDDLLDVSRISRGKIQIQRKALGITSIIHGAIETVRPHLESLEHTLSLELPQSELWIEGDAGRLNQVFGNLLHNAVKYTERGGQITLSAFSIHQQLVVSIRDNGVGIPREMLNRIFEPFTQVGTSVSRSQGGLGIGLTLVKSIVDLHGGAVEARSAGVAQGSEFIVRIPLLSSIHVPSRETSGDRPARATRNERPVRVLVVDDLKPSADTLGMMLEQLGYTVVVTHDAPSALEKSRSFHPDIVFSDIAMPGMDGYQLAAELRQVHGEQTTLVALTGFGHEQSKKQIQQAGFGYHLVKPTTIATLEEVLAKIVAGG